MSFQLWPRRMSASTVRFYFFFVRILPLPAAEQKAVNGVVHFGQLRKRLLPEFLRDALFE